MGFSSRKLWQKGYDIFQHLKAKLKGINFVGTGNIPESEMPGFYSRNHVTVVPARVDTFGLVNVESMMCGTPVISSGLQTHRVLELPMLYAKSVNDYMDNILFYKEMFDSDSYKEISEACRESSMRFDKGAIVDSIEKMFFEVSGLD